jgi:hypothetical protein
MKMKKLFVVAVVAVGVAVLAVAVSALRGQRNVGQEGAGTPKAAGVSTPAAGGGGRTPVLVELFTSEGCSSCPPADALLSRLEKTQPVEGAEVIALALHVDYWNHLGWADPFSSAEFSARQGEYASAYGKDGVYTPQMIVDGVKEFPGGNSSRALDAIGRAAREPKAEVRFRREAGPAGVRLGVRIERLPKLSEGERAYVLLAVTEGDLANDVRRGENAGRKLGHAGVVRRLTTLGPVDAAGGTFEAEADVAPEKGWRSENLKAVVFAQESGSRRVLAAGQVKLFE